MTTPSRTREPTDTSGHQPIKVPAITVAFWIAKILTTGAGESSSDYLVERFGAAIALALSAAGLVLALVLQFRARTYGPWRYWFAVVMVAVFGTMAADALHGGLHVTYLESALVFAVALMIIFVLWYRREGTLSIHSIHTRRRETFYWITVMATFAMGTAVGDLTATTFGWGYLLSGVIFAVAIGVVAVAYATARRLGSASEQRQLTTTVIAFWVAYVLTRPLGASFADWFGKPQAQGALAWGDGPVSLGLLVLIVVIVAVMASRRGARSTS